MRDLSVEGAEAEELRDAALARDPPPRPLQRRDDVVLLAISDG
jgi:hypothetical protein